jgi:hypothetical protein
MENNGFGYGQGYNANPPMPYPMMPYNSMNTQEMAQFLHAASTRMPTMPPHPYHGMPPAMISATKPKSQPPRQQRWSETEVRTFLNSCGVVSVVTCVKRQYLILIAFQPRLQDKRLKSIVSKFLEPNKENKERVSTSGASKSAKHNAAANVDWTKIAKSHGNDRTSSDCMKRYNKITGVRNNKLVAMKGPWTAEEDQKIVALVAANGARKWSQIAAELPGTSSFRGDLD